MRLQRICIPAFRNLRELDIAFDAHEPDAADAPQPPAKPFRSHALIGQNGTGKSNLGNNPAAKAKLTEVRARVRAMTSRTAELSAVARWCVLMRNDPQLSRLVG